MKPRRERRPDGFQYRVFTSPFPFCKRCRGSIGLFFRGRKGGSSYFLHSCSGREFRRGTETDRIRKSRAWGSWPKGFPFLLRRSFLLYKQERYSQALFFPEVFSFSFIQTGRCNLKTGIILRLFPLKETERRKENYR